MARRPAMMFVDPVILCGFIIIWASITVKMVSSMDVCNFENGMCGFTQAVDDNFNWTLRSGSTPSSKTGPSFDHTYGAKKGGHYIYIETSTPRAQGDTARLGSARMVTRSGYCRVKFWYHMFGTEIDTLNVYTKPGGFKQWSMSSNQQNQWRKGVFSFTCDSFFEVIFEGIRGDGFYGDIALDDIEISGFVDTINPVVFGCPLDIVTSVELGVNVTTFRWTEPTATDLSGIQNTIKSHEPGTEFPVGRTKISYTFYDRANNNATCNFVITIEEVDTIGPVISGCPHNITTSVELGIIVTNVRWTEPLATDLSGIQSTTKSHKPGTQFPVGTTLISYTFRDRANNNATCNFVITVLEVDTTPPQVTHCPSDVGSVIGRHVTWTEPTAFDISGTISQSQSHYPGMYVIATTQVVYTWNDWSGNTAVCNFTVIAFQDTILPVIIDCPADIYATAEIGDNGTEVFWIKPSAIDESGRVMLIDFTHTPGEDFPVGSTYVAYTFADDSYNKAVCNFSVRIQQIDTIPPKIISCPSDITKKIELGTLSARVYWNIPSATDLSGTVSPVHQSYYSGDRFAVGKTNVAYTFTDGSGNEADCSFTIELETVDTHAPIVVNCPSDISSTIELGSKGSAVTWTEPTATDASGNVTLLVKTNSPGNIFTIGSTNVMYMFTDASNNFAICSFGVYVYLVDTTPPTIYSCPADIFRDTELDAPSPHIHWNTPLATDLSGNVSLLFQSHFSGDEFTAGRSHVYYSFGDRSGNKASCVFDIAIKEVDTTAPKISNCPSDISTTMEMGSNGLAVTWLEPNVDDASGNVTLLSKTHSSGELFNSAYTTVMYVFTDSSKNMATCSFYITIESVDTRAPTIFNCPADISNTMEIGSNGLIIIWPEPYAIDASGNVTLLAKSHSSGELFNSADTTVMYLFTDYSNNIASCRFHIAIQSVDTRAPTISNCPVDILSAMKKGSNGQIITWQEPIAIDESGNVSLLAKTHSSGEIFNSADTTVMYLFTDSSNNLASCSFHIFLELANSTTSNIISCPSDIYARAEVGTSGIAVFWSNPLVTDNTGTLTLRASHEPGHTFPVGLTKVLYHFRNDSLNRAECSFDVHVDGVDTLPPDISTCPSDISETAEMGVIAKRVTWSEPQASDFSGNVSLASQSDFSGNYFTVGKRDISYLFVDGTGNKAWCNFTIRVTLVDTTTPTVINCPGNINTNVELGTLGSMVHWDKPTVKDASGNVTTLVQTHSPGAYFPVGTTMVSYVYSDNANNIASCIFSVVGSTVDTTSPVIYNCPSTINYSDQAEKHETKITWTEPFAIDLSTHTTLVSRTYKPYDVFKIGSTQVVYTFEDQSGNQAVCNFTVIVPKTTPLIPDIDESVERSHTGIFTEETIWISVAGLGLALLVGGCVVMLFISMCTINRRIKENHEDITLRDLRSPIAQLEMDISSTL